MGEAVSQTVQIERPLARGASVGLALLLYGCATAPVATPQVYGGLSYGFDRKSWNVICKEFPVKEGEWIPDGVADALTQEGWLIPNKPFPAAYEVNATCRRLGYTATRPDPCPTCQTPK